MPDENCVVVYASVAVAPSAVAAAVPADTSINDAFHQIVSHMDGDADTRRNLRLISRELHGAVQYLNVAPGRPVELVQPTTPVGDIAVAHEVVDGGGTARTVKAVFAEAQAHARVG